jgi:hypothetical protein
MTVLSAVLVDAARGQRLCLQQASCCPNKQTKHIGDTVSADSSRPAGELLVRGKHGEQEALRALVPLVYDEPGRLAHHHLQTDCPDVRAGYLLERW